MSNRYSGYVASFVHGGGTLTLGQIGGYNIDSGSNIDEIVPAGAVDRGANILITAASSCGIQSSDLATIFATLSPSVGLHCTGACEFQYQRRAENAVFAGGATNVTMNATKGFLAPVTLSASGSGRAMLAMQFWPLFDGTTTPLIANNGQSLVGTAAFASAFYQGPVYVNGVQVTGLLSQSVNFGIGFNPVYHDGDVWPQKGHINVRPSSISLTFANLDIVFTNIGTTLYNAALAGTIAVYFVKGTPGGTRVANITTSHCKVSAASGTWNMDSISTSENDDGTVTVTIRPTAALAVSVASAIP